MEQYIEFIRNWIAENRNIPLEEIDNNANLFEKEYLDSLSVFGMIMDLEDTYDIKFEPEELLADDASTIQGLARIATTK